MKWRWEERTRRSPWEEVPEHPLVQRLQTYMGAGNVALLRKPQDGDPLCMVNVNTTAVCARALLLLHEAEAHVVPVVGYPKGAVPGQSPGCVLLNMGRMNALLGVDEAACTAHVQTGTRWRRLEYLLRSRGLTMGPIPSWLMNRSALESLAEDDRLRPSPLYGQLVDGVLGIAAVLPGGVEATTTVAPRHSMGPDLGRITLGARHRAGLVTEAHLQAAPLPRQTALRARTYPDWAAAIAAARSLEAAGVRPAWWRLDAAEDAGGVRLIASLAAQSQLGTLADRFDDVAGGADADDAAASAIAAELFPEPTPDPKRGEVLVEPPRLVARIPHVQAGRLLSDLATLVVWGVSDGAVLAFGPEPPDDMVRRRLTRAGARFAVDGVAPARKRARKGADTHGWDALAADAFARLAAMPAPTLNPEDLPERPLRAGSPF